MNKIPYVGGLDVSRNVEKRRETSRNAEKCREMLSFVESAVGGGTLFSSHHNQRGSE